jgi:hypothetical protein
MSWLAIGTIVFMIKYPSIKQCTQECSNPHKLRHMYTWMIWVMCVYV